MGNRFKIPFELGTWAGLVAFGYFLLVCLTPFSPLGLARFGGFWIPILFIFVATYRQMKTNGPEGLSFSGAFFTGMVTALILGFAKGILVYMYIEFFDYALLQRTTDEMVRFFHWLGEFSPNPKEAEEQAAVIREAGKKAIPLNTASGEMELYLMGGLPVSLLAALIFNRKPKNA